METHRRSTTPEASWTPESSSRPEPTSGAGQSASEWAATQARGMAKTAKEGMEQAGEYIQGAMDRTREKVAEYREQGIEHMKEDVIKYTREQPLSALLIAAGGGLLLGLLMAIGRREGTYGR